MPDAVFLIPGVGAQGGDVEAVLRWAPEAARQAAAVAEDIAGELGSI